jgi:uncharacterized protein (TIGR02466 family)
MTTETIDLFPIPLTKINLGETFADEFNSLKNNDLNPSERNRASHHFSVDRYILNNEKYSNLKNFIRQETQRFMESKMAIDGECGITQSWVNWNHPKEHTHLHTHPNSIVSGVLYLEVEENKNNVIVFHRINQDVGSGKNIIEPPLFRRPNPNVERKYVDNSHPIFLKNGDLLLFASYLPHSVPPNQASTKRISLAFNSMIRHKIGGYERLTELDYKILAENP